MKILVWYDDNGDMMWDASTAQKEEAAFLRMFEAAELNGYYGYLEDISELKKEVEELKNIKGQLTNGSLHKVAQRALEHELNLLPEKERQLRAEERMLELIQQVKKGDSKSARAARRLIEMRRDHEYEGWGLIEVEDPLILKQTVK